MFHRSPPAFRQWVVHGHDDTIAIGIYDNGDFTACVGLEFRESMTHKLLVDDYDAGRYSRTYLNNV